MAAKCGSIWLTMSRVEDLKKHLISFPAHCKRFDCPKCRAKRAKMYRKRINMFYSGKQLYFYTLTFYHCLPPKEAWKAAAKSWNHLNTLLKQTYGSFTYVRILESHVDSCYPHYHILTDKFFGQERFGALLKRAGFGYQATVKRVSSSGAGNYLTKYLVKDWPRADAEALREELALRVVSFSRAFPRSDGICNHWRICGFSDSESAARVLQRREGYIASIRGASLDCFMVTTHSIHSVFDLTNYTPAKRFYERPEKEYVLEMSSIERFALLDKLGFDTAKMREDYEQLCRLSGL